MTPPTGYSQTNSGDLLGPMGWAPTGDTDVQRMEHEHRITSEVQNRAPVFWTPRSYRSVPTALEQRIEDVHQKHGMSYKEGSVDCRLVTELAFGSLYQWLAQLIGSCVQSGGNRCHTMSSLWQILLGDPEEPLGRKRLSVDTCQHYGPMSYGLGRRRGGIGGWSDGSFCGAQTESYTLDGVLDCNTPALHRIAGQSDRDFPEPQDTNLYRRFGRHEYLDTLLPYCDHRLLEAIEVKSANQSVDLLRQFKPHMICSNWGFGPTNEKAGRFTVYKRQGSWAHNMTICGVFVYNGRLFIIVLNSWGPTAHRDGEFFVIPIELYEQWLRNAQCIAHGDIDLPRSLPSFVLAA